MRRQIVFCVIAGAAALAASCGDGGDTPAAADHPDAATMPTRRPDGGAGDSSTADAGPVDLCSADNKPASTVSPWVSDESLWEVVPGLEPCGVRRAKLPSATLPTRTYCACGDGCELTAGNLEGTAGVDVDRGWYDATASYLHATSQFGKYELREVIDVTHHTTLTAIETRNSDNGGFSQCTGDLGAAPLGPSLVEAWFYDQGDPMAGNGPVTLFYARARYRETSAVDPMHAWNMVPEFDEGVIANTGDQFGYLDLHEPNVLHATADWDAGFPLPDSSPTDGQERFAELTAWGSTFAWRSDAIDHGNLYAWSTAGGMKVLARRSAAVLTASIGSTGLVWIEAGTMTSNGVYSDMQLWWIPDVSSATPTPTRIASGFAYPNRPGIVTGDGYAAFVSCPRKDGILQPADCPLVVAQLSTGKVWTLAQPSATTIWQGAFVVSARELVAGDYTPMLPAPDVPGGRRLFVLDMTKLDALVTTFKAK